MILSTFRAVIPYQRYFVLSGVLIGILHPLILSRLVEVELVPGALIPDAALLGYSPNEVLAWYEALGESGLRIYVYLGLFDVMCIIPTYVFLLSCRLLASPRCPETLAYFPSVAALFDILETSTHMYYAIYYPARMPDTLTLVVASCATQCKYVALALSLVLAAFYAVLDYRSGSSTAKLEERTEAAGTSTSTKPKQS
jgi:hypothetical protein